MAAFMTSPLSLVSFQISHTLLFQEFITHTTGDDKMCFFTNKAPLVFGCNGRSLLTEEDKSLLLASNLYGTRENFTNERF